MKSSDYIEQLRQKLELPSEYAVAKRLGVSKERVGHYRRGKEFSDEMAIRVARLLELEPLKVLADVRAQSAKDDETRRFWKSVGQLGIAAILTTSLSVSPIGSETYAPPAAHNNVYYVK